jgi:N-acyl-D-aspartate/D-glutamate deacylase
MRALTEDALRAGAFGFTTSRTDQHKTTAGELVPGRHAEDAELLGIGAALGAAGTGTFGMLSDFEDEAGEFAWMRRFHRDTGRPLWFLLTDRATDPQRWRRLMALTHAARADGAAISAQVAARQVGLILGLRTTLSPFSTKPAFADLAGLGHEARLSRLREPAVRAAILADASDERLLALLPPLHRAIATEWHRLFVLGDPPDYEPPPERSIAAMAAAAGVPPAEFAYDYLTGADGTRMLFFPAVNYNTGSLAEVRDMMLDPATVLGLSDGGAHCGVICDASMPTFTLTHWVRDRTRGPRLKLEWMVKRQTADTAGYFGFTDRGVLAPGMKADVNVIDLPRLRLHHPELVYDLPAGGKRLVQRVDGYRATLVSGVPIFQNGEETGARPGRLVRAGRIG